MFGRRRTSSARPSLLMFCIERHTARISSSLVCTGPLAVVLSHWRRDTRIDSYLVRTVDVPESPIASGARGPRLQQRCHSLHCHEGKWGSVPPRVLFFWVLDVDGAAVLPHQCHTQQWTLPSQHIGRAYFLSTRRTGMLPFIWLELQVWFVWASLGFVHGDNSSKEVVTFPLVPVQQGMCDCIAVALLHLRNFMGYPTRFAVTQNVVQNVAHSFVTYSEFRC